MWTSQSQNRGWGGISNTERTSSLQILDENKKKKEKFKKRDAGYSNTYVSFFSSSEM